MTEEMGKLEELDVIAELPASEFAKKVYPHYIPTAVIKDRELQLEQRKPRDLLRNDITKLSDGKYFKKLNQSATVKT